ncbi:MAG: ribonucleoside-diphosphate reductase subunit alpha [Chlamydiales bacterium]|nr:ribonucleoside-diphosphate reductase subunit alpha [Chlamydiales bacterium]
MLKTSGVKDATGSLESHFTVVKRDGTLVPFKRERIFRALEAAFRDTRKTPKPQNLPEDVLEACGLVADQVINQAFTLSSKGVCLNVEGIQDLVEVTLMKNGHHDVARDYIIYRDKHKELRQDSPRHMKITRVGEANPVRFNPMKISKTLEMAFRRVHKVEGASPQLIIDAVNFLTQKVVGSAMAFNKSGHQLHVQHIQDMIEEELMREGYFNVAKDFILNRAKKEQAPEVLPVHEIKETAKTPKSDPLKDKIAYACRGLKEVSAEDIYKHATDNFYDGIKDHEVQSALIMAARSQVEKEPAYAKVAARLLLDKLYLETLEISATDAKLEKTYRAYFKSYIKNAVKLERLSPELLEFDLEALSEKLVLERDDLLLFTGLQTLYDRYFIHDQQKRLETPQIFWMRVAMGLCIREEDKTRRVCEFYDVLSQFHVVSSTPTLFNSGTNHSQLSSCFLSTIDDDLENIFDVISDNAQLSKWAGGIGNDWTPVRAMGAHIKGTNGESQGVIPFLKVANDTAVAVNQGGKRKGVAVAYLETWHLDIEDFLELRKNTGDERRRTHDMNTANWIPDLFMKRIEKDLDWTLFSPSDVPDLHDLYGQAFEARYTEYERMTETGELKLFKKIPAKDLWRKMLSMLFETGHPWITFKDPSNIRSPQDHVGVVHSSNLCTEILLNTSKEETAVCNLASINLAKHVNENGIDEHRLAQSVHTAIRMLDNVIDINFYPIKKARNSNLRHRPVGLGIMGFQDALHEQSISYASHEAVQFADESQEFISYHAILASTELAKERGSYTSFQGSKWDRGILPIDSIDLLEQERGEKLEMDRSCKLDWTPVREAIKAHGMRNSNTMAIAPTATIANIVGVSFSNEPDYKHLYVKSNLSGEFTIINTYLVKKLKKLGLWDDQMIDDLKYFDGSIQEIERVPDAIKREFPTAFEIDPEWVLECASRRQKWIDMGQSLNLYLAEPSGKKLNNMYMMAWKKGLKTTYYLRSMGATQIEKSTTDVNKRGLQPRWMKNASASADITVDRAKSDAPVCNLEEGCESCQ